MRATERSSQAASVRPQLSKDILSRQHFGWPKASHNNFTPSSKRLLVDRFKNTKLWLLMRALDIFRQQTAVRSQDSNLENTEKQE
jgi:hypothetical protein